MNRPSTYRGAGFVSLGSALIGCGLLILPEGAVPLLAGSAPPPAELARVNGESLTVSDLDRLLAEQRWPGDVEGIPAHLSPDGLLQRLVQNRLIEQEGYHVGLDQKPEVRNQVWDLTRHEGMMALLDSISREARESGDEALVATFAETNTILRISHIFRWDEASTRSLHDSLEAGVPFTDLVARHSQDTTSVVGEDGDLGWARQDLYIPEFARALEGLEPGEYSEPVQSPRGWHILMLTDQRTETVGQSPGMETALRDAAKRDRVMKSVRAYVASLLDKYDVSIDSTLLASLDYGSEDKAVQQSLQANDAVLVAFPWRQLTVRDFSQEIRFKHFHGIAGKPDAAELRDKAFDEWITELLLRHEASELGLDRRPALLARAEALERRLVREAVLNMVLDVRFSPSEAELEAFYAANRADFAPPPLFRAKGILLGSEDAAQKAREQLDGGAQIGWLATRASGVVDANPALFQDWLDPGELRVDPSTLQRGTLLGPIPWRDQWVLAQVNELKVSAPLPFSECRAQVLQKMLATRRAEAVKGAVQRLEAEAEIEILDGAEDLVASRIEAWLGRPLGASRD